jgi:antitoxin PrlF
MGNALTSKGQVTIPKHIREKLGVSSGDSVVFAANDRGEMVIKAEPKAQEDFISSLKEAQANLSPDFLADLAKFNNDAVAYIRWMRGE